MWLGSGVGVWLGSGVGTWLGGCDWLGSGVGVWLGAEVGPEDGPPSVRPVGSAVGPVVPSGLEGELNAAGVEPRVGDEPEGEADVGELPPPDETTTGPSLQGPGRPWLTRLGVAGPRRACSATKPSVTTPLVTVAAARLTTAAVLAAASEAGQPTMAGASSHLERPHPWAPAPLRKRITTHSNRLGAGCTLSPSGVFPPDPGRRDGTRQTGGVTDTADPSTPKLIRVFLLDDHEVVRRGLHELLTLEDDLDVVGEASTAAEALARIPAVRPDVAVLDVRLPDGSGVEVCRDIRARLPEVNCLMLTSYSDDEALFDAIMAGAAGYVLKDIRGSDLVTAIREVASGKSLLDPQATARVLDRLRNGQHKNTELDALTDQERRILELIGEGLTNRQIGAQMHLAEKTVKNYVSSLLAKLGMERRTQAAAYIARLGEHPET